MSAVSTDLATSDISSRAILAFTSSRHSIGVLWVAVPSGIATLPRGAYVCVKRHACARATARRPRASVSASRCCMVRGACIHSAIRDVECRTAVPMGHDSAFSTFACARVGLATSRPSWAPWWTNCWPSMEAATPARLCFNVMQHGDVLLRQSYGLADCIKRRSVRFRMLPHALPRLPKLPSYLSVDRGVLGHVII